MATIYDVAERAKASIATVSKVLQGRPYVSERTRARVLAAAEAVPSNKNRGQQETPPCYGDVKLFAL